MHVNGGASQLTYCTNIHAANGWPQVQASLQSYAPPLKASYAPDAPFGLGLRLSATEARQLLAERSLADLRTFLRKSGLYVALINGYPYGQFSGEPVKANVFAPDWRTEERTRYTLDLIEILSALLPDGTDGGVSTLPLSYKPWVREGDCAWELLIRNLVRVCERLARIHRETGRLIHLDIEPEPDGLIETTAEAVAFFGERLPQLGAPQLAMRLGVSEEKARELLRRHLRICYDTCHFSVEYEEPAATFAALESAGIQIGRVQISSALAVPLRDGFPEAHAKEALEQLCDPIYLHQVVERRRDGTLRRYRDLPEALARPADPDVSEWRIHFHVPVFAGDFGGLASTREDICGTLRAQPITTHFEIETYTWNVLPESLRLGLGDSIHREYAWVLDQLCAKP